MTTSLPQDSTPASDATAGLVAPSRMLPPRDRRLDLAVLLLLLAVTALLYLLFGPGLGVVTTAAAGLYAAYRHTGTSTDHSAVIGDRPE